MIGHSLPEPTTKVLRSAVRFSRRVPYPLESPGKITVHGPRTQV